MSGLFSPLTLRDATFRNRLWVSPMCQYDAVDGMPNDWHHVHLAQFASGGAGLIVTEATAVSPEGRISPDGVGIWNVAQRDAWRTIVDAVHDRGVLIGVQLAHAGRTASTSSPFSGERGTVPAERGGWQTVAPSAIAFDGFAEPVALDAAGIDEVVADFGAAARRAVEAGFDVLEIHAAHGYLLHQFLSPLSNTRDDEYGGTRENRIRMLRRVVETVRAAAPDTAVFVRISATDWTEGGWDVDDSVDAAIAAREAGADLIDASSGGLVAHQRIAVGPGCQAGFAADIRSRAGIPVNAVGMIDDAALAEELVASGRVDAIMSAREWLRDAHYGLRAAGELGVLRAVSGALSRPAPRRRAPR